MYKFILLKAKTNAYFCSKPECGCDKLGPISQLVDHISNGLGFDCFVSTFFL